MSRFDRLIDTPEVAEASSEPDVPVAGMRRALSNHEHISLTNTHRWPAVGFGMLFAAMGSLPLLAALDVIPSKDADFHAPRALVATLCGACFVWPGLLIAVHGLRGVIRASVRARRREQHPDRPWLADHTWDDAGETRSGWRAVRRSFAGLLLIGPILASFHWFAAETPDAWPIWIGLGLFDLIMVFAVTRVVLQVVRALKYGRSWVRFDWFPFHPGDSVALRFGMSQRRELTSVRFTLRAVEEAYETSGSGKNRSTSVRSYALWETSTELGPDDPRPGPTRDVAVELPLPPDIPTTNLAARPPTYWQLEVHGEAPGADYRERFLVPVYARPT